MTRWHEALVETSNCKDHDLVILLYKNTSKTIIWQILLVVYEGSHVKMNDQTVNDDPNDASVKQNVCQISTSVQLCKVVYLN